MHWSARIYDRTCKFLVRSGILADNHLTDLSYCYYCYYLHVSGKKIGVTEPARSFVTSAKKIVFLVLFNDFFSHLNESPVSHFGCFALKYPTT